MTDKELIKYAIGKGINFFLNENDEDWKLVEYSFNQKLVEDIINHFSDKDLMLLINE